MTSTIDTRLAELGIDLPKASPPAGAYVPVVITGNLAFVSGQVTIGPKGLEYVGKVGDTISVEDGQRAARLCAVNILAQMKQACGSLDRIRRCVKVTGFVNAVPDFIHHPEVINGASDLFVEIFGDKGKHARAAVGTASLPRGVAVEVEAIFEID